MKNIKQLAMTSVFALISSYGSLASAHDVLNQPIGATLSATDYFQVTCTNDGSGAPARLDVLLKDKTAGASILSLQVQKGLLAINTTDAVGADINFSPKVSLAGGLGIYNVLVHKTTAAARVYDIQYHCMTATNIHTGTAIAQKQNQ